MDDYRAINRANWDERVPAHVASGDYGVARFAEDAEFLSDVVRFDLPLLGDVAGMRGVHLQCHIGTDTVSVARLGASMVGLDFSEPALHAARKLAEATRADAEFVQGDVYDAAGVLGAGRFDLVYTGIGALCWLPDIERWADVVVALLTPGGRLFIREGHPMLWSLSDSSPDGRIVVDYPYFQREQPDVFVEEGTYVSTEATFVNNTTHTWNHALGEVVTALLARGMRITGLAEHESVPWDFLPGQTERLPNGEYRLVDRPWRVAHSYTLQAVKER
ncbi:MAG: class I SAM-dependent methyltransferase [Solirubrobacteraceae bacterium]